MEHLDIRFPVTKMISAWLTVFLSSLWGAFTSVPWEVLAQFAAFAYSVALLWEFVSKKIKYKEPEGGTE